MKRSQLQRRTGLKPGKPLKRTELQPVSDKRRQQRPPWCWSTLNPVNGNSKSAPKRSCKPDVPAATRRAVYERDGHRCVAGGCPVGPGERQVHHRLKRSQGGDHSLPNLITLCVYHHGEVHRLTGQAYRLGYLVRRGVDPATVPIAGPWPEAVAA